MAFARELTPKQELFLAALFGEAQGDVRRAMAIAGYAKNTDSYPLLKSLHEEIVERAKIQISANAAKATIKGLEVFDDPTALGADRVLALAKEVWDRSGIVKKDPFGALEGRAIGLVLLPPKDMAPAALEMPIVEHIVDE